MSTRSRWTVNGALIGVLPGAIAALLVWAFAGCPDGHGEPGMVCYDIERFLLRIAGMTAVAGLLVGALVGMVLGSRRPAA